MSIPPAQTSAFTRDLKHLFTSVALRRAMMGPTPHQKMLWKEDHVKIVPTKERILKWNIVPGDFVRRVPNRFIPTDQPEKFEVLSIDKWQNKVYLKGTKHKDGNARHLPYSMCQLYVGDFYVGGKLQSVFAKRVGSTNIKYNWRTKRFEWIRYAEATVPPLKGHGDFPKRRVIPWPKETLPPYSGVSNEHYDTGEEAALTMSWRPFTPGKKVPSYFEDQYISDLFSNTEFPADWQPSLPMEHLLSGELINKRSRARRQERWQKEGEMLERSKEEYVRRELDNLQGRRKQDATREGAFRWKLAVQKFKATRNWQRWVKRGGQKRLELRVKRRRNQTARKLRRLKSMKLGNGKNQVIPTTGTKSGARG